MYQPQPPNSLSPRQNKLYSQLTNKHACGAGNLLVASTHNQGQECSTDNTIPVKQDQHCCTIICPVQCMFYMLAHHPEVKDKHI